MNDRPIVTCKIRVFNPNSMIQSILFLGIIFMLNLGYYKRIVSISPSQIAMMMLCIYSVFALYFKRIVVLKHMTFITMFQIYVLCVHGFSAYDVFSACTILLTLLTLLNGRLNMELFWTVLEIWAFIATILIIFQAIIFYTTGTAVDLFPVALVDANRLAEDKALHLNIVQNGIIRPAAFFAEPSHYAHFVSPLLIQYMLTEEKRTKKFKLLIIISIGVVLSTSGMGIAMVAAVWLFYIFQLLYSKKKKYLFYGICLLMIFVSMFIILFNNNAAFQKSIVRIFVASASSSSAVGGRTAGIEDMFYMLDETEFWFGTGEAKNRINGGFIGGIFQIIYQNGVIGAVLYTCIYVYSALKLCKGSRWQSLYVILISFFAGINNNAYLIYFVFTIYSGFNAVCRIDDRKNKIGCAQ